MRSTNNDYAAREQLEAPLRELSMVVEKMRDTKIVLDFDNLQSTLTYYRYVKYLAAGNEPGTTTIYKDMKQHYHGGRKTKAEPEVAATPSTK